VEDFTKRGCEFLLGNYSTAVPRSCSFFEEKLRVCVEDWGSIWYDLKSGCFWDMTG
jgi:hypothetical protein